MNGKNEIKVTILFTATFLLGGFIHVVMGPWDFTSCIAQIYYSTLVLIWAYTINYRIVNEKVRKLMLMTAALFILAFFLQMCRYRIFEYFLIARRLFWYGYYIPVILVPVLFLFVVLYLHLQEDEKPNRKWLLFFVPAILLIILVMTNDFHQLIFIFTKGTEGISGTYTHGLLFYTIYIWVIGVLVLSLYLAIKQCRVPSIGKKLWVTLYFTSFGILVVLSMFDIPKINDVTVWLFIECLAMTIIGMEESCIQLGLIPANENYQTIASHANKPFVISDEKEIPIYVSNAWKEINQKKENIQINKKTIRGGSVSWAVDLTDIMALNQEIEKATEIIENRNEYLRNENSLKEEQSRLSARNTLYNQISEIVNPQLNIIKNLLEQTEDDSNLEKIAFFNAYIKRRSNMELLKSDMKRFPAEELTTAIHESCEYLKLCHVDAMLHFIPNCELLADMQIFLYEAFEIVVESCIDTLDSLLVNITSRNNQPVLRMNLKTTDIDTDHLSFIDGIIHLSRENKDEITITITRKEESL